MPITIETELTQLTQSAFAEVAYEVMSELFALHRELGRLFDEKVYQHALSARMGNIQTEVQINVSFGDFHKDYFMDVVASKGAVFELKAVEALHTRHRRQLLNYLVLADLKHGKLVNLRPGHIEHEFVNTTLSRSERIDFDINDSGWKATNGFRSADKSLLIEILRDWGTGLERVLYEEALIHFSGGAEQILKKVDVFLDKTAMAHQTVACCAPHIAFKLTTFEKTSKGYRKDLLRFIEGTELDAIHWINISRNELTIETLQ